MPFYGGSNPFPRRYGGSPTTLQRVVESVAGARGSAYATAANTPVGVENMAIARAITFDGYGANQRLANQFLPTKVTAQTGMLQRWERIFGLSPAPTDTEPVRRARLAAKWLTIGTNGGAQPIRDALTMALGPVFVGLVNTSLAQALAYWPGGTPSTSMPWSSTVAHVLVQVQQPATYSSRQFFDAVAGIGPIMDTLLPAWATWDWFEKDSAGNIGFLLDDAMNLDFEVFDS
jgi:hypothetical protein